MPLTATKLPDGKMYLQEENPFSDQPGLRPGYQFEPVPPHDYLDFMKAHPPILALFKCTEGQRFEDGEVELVWQWKHPFDRQVEDWKTETNEDEFHTHDYSYSQGYETRQVYTLKSDKGGEKVVRNKEFQGTPGPWRWELHKSGKQLTLCGTGECGHYDFYVMDFERWGMSGATPRFRSGDNNTMCKAVDFGKIVKGREHHANWFQTINHPDAQLIAAAPELLEALQELLSHAPSIEELGGDESAFMSSFGVAIAKSQSAINKALNPQQHASS